MADRRDDRHDWPWSNRACRWWEVGPGRQASSGVVRAAAMLAAAALSGGAGAWVAGSVAGGTGGALVSVALDSDQCLAYTGRHAGLISWRIGRWIGRWIGRTGFAEPVDQAAPQAEHRLLGIRPVRFGRHGLGDVPHEGGKQQAEDDRIAVLDWRVEDREGFRRQAGAVLRGERVAVAGGVAATGWREAGPAGAEAPREPARPGWRHRRRAGRAARGAGPPGRGCGGLVRCRLGGEAGGRRDGVAQAASEGDATGQRATHGTADPADEARTDPLVRLREEAGGVGCGWHWPRIIYENFRKSS